MDGSSTTLDDKYGWENMMLYHSNGTSKKMIDIAEESGIDYRGLGRGLVVFDYDNDGDEDIVVAGNVGEPKFFKNHNNNKNNWIRINAFHKYVLDFFSP